MNFASLRLQFPLLMFFDGSLAECKLQIFFWFFQVDIHLFVPFVNMRSFKHGFQALRDPFDLEDSVGGFIQLH